MKILFLPILCVLLMIGIIIFEQTTMEIYAYGYVINRNTREKDLNEKKINQKIYKKKIKKQKLCFLFAFISYIMVKKNYSNFLKYKTPTGVLFLILLGLEFIIRITEIS